MSNRKQKTNHIKATSSLSFNEYIYGDFWKTAIPAFIGLELIYNPYFSVIKNLCTLVLVIFLLSLAINRDSLGNLRRIILFYLRLITLTFIMIFVAYIGMWLFFHLNEFTVSYALSFLTNITSSVLTYEYLSKLSGLYTDNDRERVNHLGSLIPIIAFSILNILIQLIF